MGEEMTVTNKHKILLADDDIINRKLLSTQIQRAGMEALTAENGKEAVDSFNANPDIAVVLLDLHMPEMNGSDAMQEIRKASPTIPILAITGEAGIDEELIQAGFSDVLTKPLIGKGHIEKILSLCL